MNKHFDLAIVGFGPRGLYTLEQFYLHHSQNSPEELPTTVIFEEGDELGVGKAWSVHQPAANWINIADRALEPFPSRPAMRLSSLEIPEFPSYLQWLDRVMNHQPSDVKDTFHERRVMGSYLTQRTTSLLKYLKDLDLITVISERVEKMTIQNTAYSLHAKQDKNVTARQVMLTMGHLPTELSDENQQFQQHAEKDGVHFSAACYSHEAMDIYAPACQGTTGRFAKAICIKGLGLSMIDVVRMILEHDAGNFEKVDGSYHLKYVSADQKPVIIPYSLDGLPSIPKPLGNHIDQYFNISHEKKSDLFKKLKKLRDQENTEITDLLQAIATEMSKVYLNLENTYSSDALSHKQCISLMVEWLQDPSKDHEHILSKDLPIIEYIDVTCGMAVGAVAPSLDYAMGQMWRQLQPDFYNIFSYKTRPELLSEFIKVDERTKRYSYGPPVESMLQLLALEKAGILNFDFVADPDVEMVEKGFKISSAEKSIIAPALIDAILDGPDVGKMGGPLIKDLLKNQFAEQIHEGLGFHVDYDTTHIVQHDRVEGLHTFSRLSKGSIYGVDAILECFNKEKLEGWIKSL